MVGRRELHEGGAAEEQQLDPNASLSKFLWGGGGEHGFGGLRAMLEHGDTNSLQQPIRRARWRLKVWAESIWLIIKDGVG